MQSLFKVQELAGARVLAVGLGRNVGVQILDTEVRPDLAELADPLDPVEAPMMMSSEATRMVQARKVIEAKRMV
ncbi:hypothetical protein DL89DRAFT_265160, partial [Linderina pennispora]